MKAYKDLNKTQECEDGHLVAVAVMDVVADLAQQPEWHPVFTDNVLDAEYVSD